MSKAIINQEQIMQLLDKCYLSAIQGLPRQQTCEQVA